MVTRIFNLKLVLILGLVIHTHSQADNHNIYETLEQIQNDIKTLRKLFIVHRLK